MDKHAPTPHAATHNCHNPAYIQEPVGPQISRDIAGHNRVPHMRLEVVPRGMESRDADAPTRQNVQWTIAPRGTRAPHANSPLHNNTRLAGVSAVSRPHEAPRGAGQLRPQMKHNTAAPKEQLLPRGTDGPGNRHRQVCQTPSKRNMTRRANTAQEMPNTTPISDKAQRDSRPGRHRRTPACSGPLVAMRP